MVNAAPAALRPALWRDRSVFVTGHTGFKGAWLAYWLSLWGARVHGYALDPATNPNLFDALGLDADLASDSRADLSDLAQLQSALRRAQPTVVFHLAAQSLVRESYRDPVKTVATNVLGTAHLLEAVRQCPSVEALIVVTTDKVYENREWAYPYRENDRLGGHDLYSASKAACELITAAFRSSFVSKQDRPLQICTVRAGNVIGGGDWASDRLVPDCMRAFAAGRPVVLRQPRSVRPWQHVLDPLSGYLLLAEHLLSPGSRPDLAPAWNFGPDAAGDESVGVVAHALARLWGEGAHVQVDAQGASGPHEAGLLRLDPSLAHAVLGWRCRWSLTDALARTVDWYRAAGAGGNVRELCRDQISDFVGGLGTPARTQGDR